MTQLLNNLNNWFTVFEPHRLLRTQNTFQWARDRGCYSWSTFNPIPEYMDGIKDTPFDSIVWSYKVYLPE